MNKFIESKLNSKYFLYFPPAIISILIAFVFYPGAMSYDTLHALYGNRHGVTDSMWPPMVSYVWRFIDLFSQNPSLMHFSQILVLFISLNYIIFYFIKDIRLTTKTLIIYTLIPAVLGTLCVIWKDVLMSSFLFAGLALSFVSKDARFRKLLVPWTWTCFLCLSFSLIMFLGICSRHNAITGAVPILFYFSFLLFKKFTNKKSFLLVATFLCGLLATGTLFFGKSLIDIYSLPSFTQISNPSQYFIRVTKTLDVAGASVCLGENLFKDINSQITMDEINNGFDPKHVNLSAAILAKVGIDPRIDQVWLDTFIHHPICAWYNKFHMTRFMLGANWGDQFLITKEEIDENEFGYAFKKSSLRDLTYKYIAVFSKISFLRPWFILLMALISFFYLLKSKKMTMEIVVTFMSGLFYLGSLILFGNAADARLPFYSTSCFYIVAALGFIEYKKTLKQH